MLWDHYASPTFLLLSAIFCQKGNKLLFPFLEVPNADDLQRRASSGCSGDFEVYVDSSVTISDLNKQFDLKSIRFSCITNSTKEGDDPRGNKENNWCISSPHDRGRQSFYNVSAVIYKTKDFVMSVAVNNDVHNIPELVNKETAVKLRNNLNSQWMRKGFLRNQKAW